MVRRSRLHVQENYTCIILMLVLEVSVPVPAFLSVTCMKRRDGWRLIWGIEQHLSLFIKQFFKKIMKPGVRFGKLLLTSILVPDADSAGQYHAIKHPYE